MLKILIFGGTSFLGRSLSSALLKLGHDVANVSRGKSILPRVTNYNYEMDIEELNRIFKPEIIIYISCVYDNTNVSGQVDVMLKKPIEILTFFEESKMPPKFITLGSYWQFGSLESPNIPIDKYSCAKKALSTYIDYYNAYTRIICKEVVLFGTYGFGDSRTKIVDLIIGSNDRKSLLAMSPGEQWLNLMYIEDVTLELIGVIFNDEENRKYVIRCENNYRLKDIVSSINEKLPVNVNLGALDYRNNEIIHLNVTEGYQVIEVKDRLKWYIEKKINENNV